MYLWLTVFFYSVGIHLFFKYLKKNSLLPNKIIIEFFPIIFKRYWYFTAYFGMYLFLPIINNGISFLSKAQFKFVVISTLFVFVIWKDLQNPNKDVFNMESGYSMIWLLTLYLVGAYIGKYKVDYSGIKHFIFCFIYSFLYLLISFLYIQVRKKGIILKKGYNLPKLGIILVKILRFRYDSIVKVLQSITTCLFFLQIRYNKYISKIICFLGPHTFGIYLIHNNHLVIKNFVKHIYESNSNNLSPCSVLFQILIKPLKMFIFCVIIDYFRNLLFILLKIRKFCILLEEKIKQLF